jgi:hypothetical protein
MILVVNINCVRTQNSAKAINEYFTKWTIILVFKMGLAILHARLSPRKTGFCPVPVHSKYVLDTMIMEQVSVRVLPLSDVTTSPSILHIYLYLNTYSYQTDKRSKPGDLRRVLQFYIWLNIYIYIFNHIYIRVYSVRLQIFCNTIVWVTYTSSACTEHVSSWQEYNGCLYCFHSIVTYSCTPA